MIQKRKDTPLKKYISEDDMAAKFDIDKNITRTRSTSW